LPKQPQHIRSRDGKIIVQKYTSNPPLSTYLLPLVLKEYPLSGAPLFPYGIPYIPLASQVPSLYDTVYTGDDTQREAAAC